jgi:hypothetical protein
MDSMKNNRDPGAVLGTSATEQLVAHSAARFNAQIRYGLGATGAYAGVAGSQRCDSR